ncbi:DUF962 domain-containing protein [Lutimonas vermicola]|uniref:DUF962 domain-containing protein n=1 Tax=Lutimonas vermicola TaxID=414288 RepID=A0ABU9L2T3_9FLAO
MKEIKSYSEFYRFYLTEHQNKTCRSLHFIGTFLVFVLIFLALYLKLSVLWYFVPLMGYGFAWVGHYYFEKNKPATFTYPFWSLVSDFRMFFDIVLGRISLDGTKDRM